MRKTTAAAAPAARTRKAPAIPTVHPYGDGQVMLVDAPFHIEGFGRGGRLMGGQGLGWTFVKDDAAGVKGWVTDAAPGAVAECVDAWAAHNVVVVDLTGAGKSAPAKRSARKATPAPAAAAPAAPAPAKRSARKATPAPAAEVAAASTLAERIAAALADVDPAITAAAIAAAVGAADAAAKQATAGVSTPDAPAKRSARKASAAAPVTVTRKAAAPAKQAAATAAPAAMDGATLKQAATAARKALAAAKITGVSVKRENGELVAYRADGAAVDKAAHAVIDRAVAEMFAAA
ncbi:hypothetical protein [Actinoplanes sp. URMC 104]|uniref:hypothetical protein n=1 Tax=Actinoplanes sp. URMC 104 TaxID=3423409 RepID=UPI003F1D2BD4